MSTPQGSHPGSMPVECTGNVESGFQNLGCSLLRLYKGYRGTKFDSCPGLRFLDRAEDGRIRSRTSKGPKYLTIAYLGFPY